MTSGRRSIQRNNEVDGNDASKHLQGMARDYALPDQEEIEAAARTAARLGFWFKFYDWGIHLQGLPPGTIAQWWLDKYDSRPA